MIKNISLLVLLALFSLQFVAYCQFLPISWSGEDNEEGALEEGNEECEWIWEEEYNTAEDDDWIIDANTVGQAVSAAPSDSNEAVGDAISGAAAQINSAIASSASDIGTQVANSVSQNLQTTRGVAQADADNYANQIGSVVTNVISSAQNNNAAITEQGGDLATAAVAAFRNARDNGEDVGVAVGAVVANALRQAANNSDAVGDGVGNAITNGLQGASANSIDQAVAAGGLEASAENYVNLLGDNADDIANVVASSLNGALTLTQDRAQVAGVTASNVAQAIRDNSAVIGEAVANATTDAFESIPGVDQADLDQIKSSVQNDTTNGINNAVTTPEQINFGVLDAINAAAGGTQANTDNFNTMITNVGQDIASNIAASINSEIAREPDLQIVPPTQS